MDEKKSFTFFAVVDWSAGSRYIDLGGIDNFARAHITVVPHSSLVINCDFGGVGVFSPFVDTDVTRSGFISVHPLAGVVSFDVVQKTRIEIQLSDYYVPPLPVLERSGNVIIEVYTICQQ